MDKYFDYRISTDGSTWSDVEVGNPSVDGVPANITDFAPRVIIRADGILDLVWIRGDASTGYGDIRHRMRDLY